MFKVINVKENQPECEYAVFLVEKEIDCAPKEDVDVLIVIHGYGSHGVGGTIKNEVRIKLKELKSNGKIRDFIPGEMWSDLNESKCEITQKYPNLSINSQLVNLNSGITIVKLF